MRSQGGRSIIYGDLNACHTRWNGGVRMSRGGIVFKLLLERPSAKQLSMLREPSAPTRFGVTSQSVVVGFFLDILLSSLGKVN